VKEKKVSVGGQAVIEGVMMKGPEYLATAVRRPNGEIVYRRQKLKKNKFKINKIPFLRGSSVLVQSLMMGMKELSFSAYEAGEDEEEELTKTQMAMTLTLSMAIGILIFFGVPSLAGSFFGKIFFEDSIMAENIIEGILRLLVFLGYVIGISFIPDIKRVFQYHGAEHKSIYTYEAEKELNVENVKAYTTLHPRCGTSFLIIVMVISILVFAVVDILFISGNPVAIAKDAGIFQKILYVLKAGAVKLGWRIVFLPLVAGISYEFQRITGKYIDNPIAKLVAFPGLMLQKITTKEPDDEQMEVSIVALKAALGEQEISNAEDISEKYFGEKAKNKLKTAE